MTHLGDQYQLGISNFYGSGLRLRGSPGLYDDGLPPPPAGRLGLGAQVDAGGPTAGWLQPALLLSCTAVSPQPQHSGSTAKRGLDRDGNRLAQCWRLGQHTVGPAERTIFLTDKPGSDIAQSTLV